MIPIKGLPILTVIGVAGCVLLGGWWVVGAHHPEPGARAHEFERRETRMPIPDFVLTDERGQSFEFKTLRGRLVLLTFVYTTCPDLCPLVTVSMRSVQRGLSPKERASVYFLSVTTDPEIDRPEILKSYGERHQVDFTNWSFLTGSSQQLAGVWETFGIKVLRKGRGLVSHTSLTALVDQRGRVRWFYVGAAPDAKVILNDLRALLNSG